MFPGQGSQYIGMAKDFYEEFHIARDTFNVVENSTKINIKDIIFKNKSELLNITQYTQLAIFCASMSIFNVLKNAVYQNKNFSITYSLGHSLGEYSALTASNVITLEDCSKLLKLRGELMQNAYKENMSGMAAIIGLDCSKVDEIISINNLDIEVANDNSPQQVVVSGTKADLLKAEPIIVDNGAKKYVYLNVSAAFHSKIMKNAQEKLKLYLDKLNFRVPSNSVISNYSAKDTKDPKVLFKNLTNQMSNKVKWVDSIKCLAILKETNIIEIGPGKVLSNLVKRISNNFTVTNISSIVDFDNFINKL